MKIRISTNDYREFVEFPIVTISYELDGEGNPIDITIAATKEVLAKIATFSNIGWNMHILDDYTPQELSLINAGATHQALYARLNSFEVLEANHVSYN